MHVLEKVNFSTINFLDLLFFNFFKKKKEILGKIKNYLKLKLKFKIFFFFFRLYFQGDKWLPSYLPVPNSDKLEFKPEFKKPDHFELDFYRSKILKDIKNIECSNTICVFQNNKDEIFRFGSNLYLPQKMILPPSHQGKVIKRISVHNRIILFDFGEKTNYVPLVNLNQEKMEKRKKYLEELKK